MSVCADAWRTERKYSRYFWIAAFILRRFFSLDYRYTLAQERFSCEGCSERGLPSRSSGLHADRRCFFRGSSRGLFRRFLLRRQLFPISSFFYARPHRADLRFLFHDKRRTALRARLRNGHERRREIAIGVPRAAV